MSYYDAFDEGAPALSSTTAELDIINMALDWLDEEFALESTDDRPSVQLLVRNFAQTRDALLSQHPWNFAIEAQDLTTSAASVSGWDREFTIPAGVLRILPLQENGAHGGYPIRHEVRGGKILVKSGSPLKVRYIARITDVTKFPALFVEALALALALRVAHAITHKQSYVERINALYLSALLNAQMIDSQEGSAEDPVVEFWDIARFTGV